MSTEHDRRLEYEADVARADVPAMDIDLSPALAEALEGEERAQRRALHDSVRALRLAVAAWQQWGDRLHRMAETAPQTPKVSACVEEWHEQSTVVDAGVRQAHCAALEAEAMRAYGVAGHHRRKLAELEAEAAEFGIPLTPSIRDGR